MIWLKEKKQQNNRALSQLYIKRATFNLICKTIFYYTMKLAVIIFVMTPTPIHAKTKEFKETLEHIAHHFYH